MAEHGRKRARKYVTKAALVGGATATATAMTVGMAAPSANAAATGPDYTQIITDSSNSLDNLLVTAGNIGGAAAAIWNPLAAAIPGGLLPTFTAATSSLDLTNLADIIPALTAALTAATNLAAVPGLPAGASTTILNGLLEGLGLTDTSGDSALSLLTTLVPQLVTAVSGQVGTLNNVIGILDALNTSLGGVLGGIPTLGDLLGVTATQTTFNSTYNWPLLGLGPLLGLDGSTTISNTFAQLPSLTATSLVDNILNGLTISGEPLSSDPAVYDTVQALLNAANLINTPSVTAWIPAGTGVYGLPLGGSFGWLSTMPTVDVGPIDILGIPVTTTDTVLALPLNAAGAVLPLGLATFGAVNTPGVVFPTATGVSTLGGTSLTSFAVPLLGLSATNVNLLSATYVGTNGINYNSGTNELTLTTPMGVLPIVFSLGSFNVGTTGYGFTGPSLFGIGLLPSFQIGTAPTNQSDDGLIPAAVLNLGLAVPTQTNDLVTMLGLPNPGSAVEAFLNPVFAAVVAPVGAQITSGLNSSVGPLFNSLASGFDQFTALLARLSDPPSTAATPAAITAQTIKPAATAQTNKKSSVGAATTQNAPDHGAQKSGPTNTPKRVPVLTIFTAKGNSANGTGGAHLNNTVNNAPNPKTTSSNAGKQASTALSGVFNPGLHTAKDPVGGHSKVGK